MFKTAIKPGKEGLIVLIPFDEIEEFDNMVSNLPTRYPRELKEQLKAYT